MTITIAELEKVLHDKFHGIITIGSHGNPAAAKLAECCVLELYSFVKSGGEEWDENPYKLDMYDFRPLNDIPITSNKLRTDYMVKLLVKYQDCLLWDLDKQRRLLGSMIGKIRNMFDRELDNPTVVSHLRTAEQHLDKSSMTYTITSKRKSLMFCSAYLNTVAYSITETIPADIEVFTKMCDLWLSQETENTNDITKSTT